MIEVIQITFKSYFLRVKTNRFKVGIDLLKTFSYHRAICFRFLIFFSGISYLL